MEYIILDDGGGTAIQFSDGDIVVYGDEQEARDDMMANDILVGISCCDDNDGSTDDSVQHYNVVGMDNKVEYADFELRAGDDFQEKLKAIFLPQMD